MYLAPNSKTDNPNKVADASAQILVNTQPISNEDRLLTAIRLSARRFLGHGYSRGVEGGQLRQMVLCDFPDTDIDISHQENIRLHKVGENVHDTLTELHHSVGIKFKIGVNEEISGSGSTSSGSVTRTMSQNKDIVFTFLHIQRAQCSLRTLPPLTAGKTIRDLDIGDSFVRAGIVYIGYYVNITLHTTINTCSTTSKSNSAANGSYVSLASFGLSREEKELFLTDRQVTSVTMYAHGFGGYDPQIILPAITNLEQASNELSSIEHSFSSSLINLKNWEIQIDQGCGSGHIEEYTIFGPLFVAPPPSLPGSPYNFLSSPPVKQTSVVFNQTLYYDLAQEIYSKLSERERGVLTEINLNIMLESIKEFFSGIANETNKHNDKKNPILVLGHTGAGKSTLIGYLLGQELVYKPLASSKIVLDYSEPRPSFPVIGHRTYQSTTKGGHLYTIPNSRFEYIDCAGAVDTSGVEADICNAMAISMLIKLVPPKKIVVVCDPTDITLNKGTNFIDLIDRLRRCLKNPTDQRMWSSILFLANDHNPPGQRSGAAEMKELILHELGEAIDSIQEECKRLIPPKSRLTKILELLEIDDEDLFEEDYSNSHPPEPFTPFEIQTNRRVSEYQCKKQILALLRKYHNMLIVTDFSTNNTKTSVLAALNTATPSSLPKDFFTPEHLYDDKISQLSFQFNTVLVVVASYFNEIVLKKDNYASIIADLNNRLRTINDAIERAGNDERQLTANPQLFISQNSGRIKEIDEKLGIDDKQKPENNTGKYKEHYSLVTQLQILENHISKEHTDNTPTNLPSIGPIDPISPRPFFSWSANRYTFKYHGIPFLTACLQIPPERKRSFNTAITICDPDAGTYEAYYEPAWWKYEEDCNIKAIIQVRAKDHPATHAKIRELKTEQDIVKEHLKNLNASIAGLKFQKEQLQSTIVDNIRARILEGEGRLVKERDNIAKDLEQNMKELAEIESKITSYSDFCMLLTNIITTFGLESTSTTREREIFVKFINTYQIPDTTTDAESVNVVGTPCKHTHEKVVASEESERSSDLEEPSDSSDPKTRNKRGRAGDSNETSDHSTQQQATNQKSGSHLGSSSSFFQPSIVTVTPSTSIRNETTALPTI